VESICNGCGGAFTREYKRGIDGDNVWYTRKDGLLLRGVPNCFENYTYTCADEDCGGKVTREHTALDGETAVTILSNRKEDDGVWRRQYRTFYECSGCKVRVEVSDD
jgi:hypothetical protein